MLWEVFALTIMRVQKHSTLLVNQLLRQISRRILSSGLIAIDMPTMPKSLNMYLALLPLARKRIAQSRLRRWGQHWTPDFLEWRDRKRKSFAIWPPPSSQIILEQLFVWLDRQGQGKPHWFVRLARFSTSLMRFFRVPVWPHHWMSLESVRFIALQV